MPCAICQTRKPRRPCPAVGSDICTTCCALGREETIHCPRDCSYLREAHVHENLQIRPEPASIPNIDIEITEEFLARNEILMAFVAVALLDAVEPIPEATDWDVREALEALIKTLRTATESGIWYEAKPDNQYAASIAGVIRSKIDEIRRRESEATGGTTTLADSVVLGVLAFMQRLEYSRNNGRSRCRSFIDFLRSFYAASGEIRQPDASPVIL